MTTLSFGTDATTEAYKHAIRNDLPTTHKAIADLAGRCENTVGTHTKVCLARARSELDEAMQAGMQLLTEANELTAEVQETETIEAIQEAQITAQDTAEQDPIWCREAGSLPHGHCRNKSSQTQPSPQNVDADTEPAQDNQGLAGQATDLGSDSVGRPESNRSGANQVSPHDPRCMFGRRPKQRERQRPDVLAELLGEHLPTVETFEARLLEAANLHGQRRFTYKPRVFQLAEGPVSNPTQML